MFATLLRILVLVVIIGAIYYIVKKKNDNNNDNLTVKNLTASLNIKDDVPYININYTNPSSFGPSGSMYYKTLFYILDYNSTITPPPNPTVTQLLNQKYYNSATDLPAIDTKFMSKGYDTASAQVTVDMNTSGILTNFTPTLNSKYFLGIGIANDKITSDGYTSYGDFTYITIGYSNSDVPGDVNITSAEITIN
jgi:hypothetical protein